MAVSLKDKVDAAMPGWERWYPSLFDAAVDLGILRARVCAPSSLLLSNRHSQVRDEAQAMHRDRWGGDFSNEESATGAQPASQAARRRKKKKTRKAGGGKQAPSARATSGVKVTPRQRGAQQTPRGKS